MAGNGEKLRAFIEFLELEALNNEELQMLQLMIRNKQMAIHLAKFLTE